MIVGRVSDHHAMLPLSILLPGQSPIEIEFVLDTGFAGFLTLPAGAVTALELPYSHSIAANLADDSTIRVAVHIAVIEWDGLERDVEVIATGSRPLLGTLLLYGHGLEVAFIDHGGVMVNRM